MKKFSGYYGTHTGSFYKKKNLGRMIINVKFTIFFNQQGFLSLCGLIRRVFRN